MGRIMINPGRFSGGKGFTLVELMIGVSIIVVLAAISIPSYIRMIESAKTKLCIAQQKVLFESASLYEINEKTSLKNVGGQKARLDRLVAMGYIRHADGFECPASPVKDYDDYLMVFDGNDSISDVECTLEPVKHKWP